MQPDTDAKALFAQLERVISPARLGTYLRRASGDHERALADYHRNIEVGEVFYGLLQWLEVILRNALHRQMCIKFTVTWYQTRQDLLHVQSGSSPHFLSRSPKPSAKLADAVAKLDELKPGWGAGDLVAELSFGFWTSILGSDYENKLWRPALRHAFPHGPRTLLRKQVHRPLNDLRDLRNRITHHEPILMINLRSYYNKIIELISWVCPRTSTWLKQAYDPRVDRLLPYPSPPSAP